MCSLCTVSAIAPAKMSPARGGGLPLSCSHCPSSPRNSSCHLVSTHSVLAGSKKRRWGQGESGGKVWSPECGGDCGHWGISEPGREAGRLPEKRALHSDSLGERRYQCLQRDPGNGGPESQSQGHLLSQMGGMGQAPASLEDRPQAAVRLMGSGMKRAPGPRSIWSVLSGSPTLNPHNSWMKHACYSLCSSTLTVP